MIFYHNGVAIQPSVTRAGRAFVARASILEEGGETKSLGELGLFASKDGAYRFAIKCAIAFVDGESLPHPPLRMIQQRSSDRRMNLKQSKDGENTLSSTHSLAPE